MEHFIAKSTVAKRMQTTVRGYILRGTLVLVPLGVTAYVLALCYRATAGHLVPLIEKYAVQVPGYAVEALSVLLFFSLLYLLGLTTAVVVGKRLLALGEAILLRIPLIKPIYVASKQLVDLITPKEDAPGYESAVLVGFPNKETKTFGLITGKISVVGEGDFHRVFVPTTPNPTSGFFLMVGDRLVQKLNLSVEEVVRAIMSVGILVADPVPVLPGGRIGTGEQAAADGPGATPEGEQASQVAPPRKGLWARTRTLIRNRILSGFLALVPAAVTAFVIKFAYDLTAGRITPVARALFGQLPDYAVGIASILLLLGFLYVTGYVGTRVLGGRLIRLMERIIERIPLVTTVYGAAKQIVETIFQHKEGGPSFQTPVVVEFPYPGVRTIGFELGAIQTTDGAQYIRVFVPTSPNVSVGLLELFEPHRVFRCDLAVEDAVKMVISAGMIGPASIKLIPSQHP